MSAARRLTEETAPPQEASSTLMRAVGWVALWLALALACSSAAAGQLQVVPDEDGDVAAGWSAYRANDQVRALAHYRKAAERNNRVAQFNLAVMLFGGEGAVADPAAGVGWLRKSAERGFSRAQFALALLYERGEHVTKSQEEQPYGFAGQPNRIISRRRSDLRRNISWAAERRAISSRRRSGMNVPPIEVMRRSAYIVASLYEKGEGSSRITARLFLLQPCR